MENKIDKWYHFILVVYYTLKSLAQHLEELVYL